MGNLNPGPARALTRSSPRLTNLGRGRPLSLFSADQELAMGEFKTKRTIMAYRIFFTNRPRQFSGNIAAQNGSCEYSCKCVDLIAKPSLCLRSI